MDVYEKILHPSAEADEATKLRLGRAVLVASGNRGPGPGLGRPGSGLLAGALRLGWPGLGPALILSLFWKGATRDGIAAGMVTGTVVTIAWRLWLREPTGLYELVPAFALATAAIVLVSLAERKGREPRD